MRRNKDAKGYMKDYSKWMADEIDDYAFEYEPSDILPMYFTDRDNALNNSQSTPYQPKAFNTKSTTSKTLKFQPDTDFNTLWEKLPQKFIQLLVGFLHRKDFINLIPTCKALSQKLDNDDNWALIVNRDHLEIANLLKHVLQKRFSSAKQFYRFWIYKSLPGLKFHSAMVLKGSSDSAVELTKSLVDIKAVRNSGFGHYMQSIIKTKGPVGKNKLPWRTDLKLSWDKLRNEIYLWIAGFEIIEKILKGNSYSQKNELLIPYVLREFRFRKEERIVQTYFLEEKLLVVEVKEEKETLISSTKLKENDAKCKSKVYEEQKEQVKIPQDSFERYKYTFIVIDLEKEFKFKMDGQEFPHPFRCTFYRKMTGKEKLLLEPDSLETLHCEIDIQETTPGRTNINLKTLNQEELMFFTSNTRTPTVIVVNRNTKKKVQEFVIQLDDVMFDLIPLKFNKKPEEIKLAAIDINSKVYTIQHLQEGKTIVHKLKMKYAEENKEGSNKDSNQVPILRKFLNREKKHHYGITKVQKDEEEEGEVEYLVVNKNRSFNFINLESLKIYEFHFTEAENIPVKILNWNIYRENLCILSQSGFSVYQFSINKQVKNQVNRVKMVGWEVNSWLNQWFYVGPCYSIIVGAPVASLKRGDIQVSAFSTHTILQQMPFGKYELDLDNILSTHNIDISGQSTPIVLEDVQVKLEDNVILIKTSIETFFCDLEGYRNLTPTSQKCDLSSCTLRINCKKEMEKEKEKDKANQHVVLVGHTEIPENFNHELKKKVKIPKDIQKKTNKEEMQEDRIVRQKGTKYYKNVRSDKQLEKQLD